MEKKAEILALFGEPGKKEDSALEYYLAPFPAANVYSLDKMIIAWIKTEDCRL